MVSFECSSEVGRYLKVSSWLEQLKRVQQRQQLIAKFLFFAKHLKNRYKDNRDVTEIDELEDRLQLETISSRQWLLVLNHAQIRYVYNLLNLLQNLC